jgi:Golgi nucleoside diphosphatase
MYIYKWISGFSVDKGDPLVIDQVESCKTEDQGIDKINDKQELITSFKNCIQKAHEKVPHDRQKRTYIFLAATAGMRLLEYDF